MSDRLSALRPGHQLTPARRAQMLDHWYRADKNLYEARAVAIRRSGATPPQCKTPTALREEHLQSAAIVNAATGADAAYLGRLSHGLYGAWHRTLRSVWAHSERSPHLTGLAMGTAVYIGTEALGQLMTFGTLLRPDRLIAAAVMMYPSVWTLGKFLHLITDRCAVKPADHTAAAALAAQPSLGELWRTAHQHSHAVTCSVPSQFNAWLRGCRSFLQAATPLHRLGLRSFVFAPLWAYSYMAGMALAGAIAGHGYDALHYFGTIQETLVVSLGLLPVEYFIQNHMRVQNKLPASMARSLIWGIGTSLLNLH